MEKKEWAVMVAWHLKGPEMAPHQEAVQCRGEEHTSVSRQSQSLIWVQIPDLLLLACDLEQVS